jgi:YfiH family protein
MPAVLELIIPEWPAPAQVRGLVTTRAGGVSVAPYASLNLAHHVGDDPDAVAENRAWLMAYCRLPEPPRWLTQVHGARAVEAAEVNGDCTADASVTAMPGVVCAVLTADCLPVMLCDRSGSRVGITHAGWRGLAAGVLESAISALGCPAHEIMAWLGPAIGPEAFEVGDEVRSAFLDFDPAADLAFRRSPWGRWLADIYALARQRLHRCGVHDVYGGEWCTYNDAERFYSYRRDGVTGRMAALIWREGA